MGIILEVQPELSPKSNVVNGDCESIKCAPPNDNRSLRDTTECITEIVNSFIQKSDYLGMPNITLAMREMACEILMQRIKIEHLDRTLSVATDRIEDLLAKGCY